MELAPKSVIKKHNPIEERIVFNLIMVENYMELTMFTVAINVIV